MADFSVSEILKATGGHLLHAGDKKVFRGVSTDTRNIKSSNLFIALVGERFDGNDFVAQAAAKGAAGLLVSRAVSVPAGVTVIQVTNTLQALQALAKFHRQRFSIPLVAVTGSNGKTTTKDMLAAVLSGRFKVLKTEANFNNEIGLSLTLLQLEPSHEAAVVEMGMRARGEIHALTEIALPTVGVVTNVGETHMEILGSIENIAAAKAELVEAIGHDDLVVLNGDDPHVRAMQRKAQGRVVLYGLHPDAFVRAENIVTGKDGELITTFDCCSPRGSFPVTLAAVGIHNVYNALAAIATGWELGLKPSEIKAGITSFVPGAMRLEVKRYGDITVINDVYNASPLSMAAALNTLTAVSKGRKIAVLGDMLELGDAAVEAHRRIGRQAAENEVAILISVGEMAKHIAAAARESGVKTTYSFAGHQEAIEVLRQVIQPGDCILLKGSRGMKMETMLHTFQDKSLS
ncbi:UDP-N-acetylmuramoyl-tripeptide--D-alanyl-D-alanine ligase [Sporomusa acidovorans]|uniref:UDP-N-acetylmuramoyl-tripeptide--D-alanyl-D-alanine ligase n=1 Tax=Sporomusa acidovorans (strain ATCC 49682 / DSM 3132 / Mol) TaxID=1123286 RepID=A0ABZ3J142_SPOA4|nr:UDP-N-acetylmuramoyl-tripeptide--D-alanyl-D-alanine ligase [Sporomusa acidovorans]OZC13602.1 UDP-N-acetylmuramoyl-tripeptide--D-alanyl-D-alanine ligase [Sporomusa acidovorans DSM 3132]SDE87029.1 UDP-N-acetylmuramoyl-tripeptide--D-alanyl-D-alanine ligase [Sporomusa acidovorans]